MRHRPSHWLSGISFEDGLDTVMQAGASDVVVVGAGVIGCAIARELSRRGLRVVVLESRTAGAGATQASAGVLAPYIEAPAESPLQALTVRSLAMYDRFIAELRRDTDVAIEYARCGTLEVAFDAASADRLKSLGEWTRSVGVESRWIDASGVRDLEPAAAATAGGLVVPSHGYVRASQLTAALLDAARRAGAAFEPNRRVDRVEFGGDGVLVAAGEARYRARTVVIAAGSWSTALADATAVRPVRGQLLQLQVSGSVLQRVLWSESCYMVPWNDGTVLVGATVEDVGFDERTTGAGVRDLLAAATAVLPALADATFVTARAGLRPLTPTGLPVIERSREHPALISATGHYRNGILLAPLTAQLVGELVVD
jgi:glycine oxidase